MGVVRRLQTLGYVADGLPNLGNDLPATVDVNEG